MRQIKFRAWDTWNKKMVFKNLFDRNWYFHPKKSQLAYECKTHKESLHSDIMQFTGIKDKDEKEIYEGDIVEYDVQDDGEKANYKVEWCEYGRWTLKRIGSKDWASVGTVEWEITKKIGNIYENPELLK